MSMDFEPKLPTKIYEHLDDLHIRNYVLYNSGAGVYLYKDPDCTEKISAAELKDYFLKGLVIETSEGIVKPTVCVESGDAISVAIDANTVFYSKEYAAS